MIVLVTGSRIYDDWDEMRAALRQVSLRFAITDPVLIEGGAKGADTLARMVATGKGWEVRTREPIYACHMGVEHNVPKLRISPCRAYCDRESHPECANIRNQRMVDEAVAGAEDHYGAMVIAFPVGEAKGTRDCMARAKAAGIPVYRMRQGVLVLDMDDQLALFS